MPAKSCCLKEAKLRIKKHRDVATCDQCGSLILAYADAVDFAKITSQLKTLGTPFETAKLDRMDIVIKTK